MDGKCISILVHYLSSKLVCYYSMKVWKEERKKEGTTKKVKVQQKKNAGTTVQRKKSRYNEKFSTVQRKFSGILIPFFFRYSRKFSILIFLNCTILTYKLWPFSL